MLEQIESLRKTIDRQGEMITRLLEAVAASQNSRNGGDETGSANVQPRGIVRANGNESAEDVFGGTSKDAT